MPKGKDEEKTVAEEVAAVDDVMEKLKQLGAELQEVAGDKLARSAKLKELETVLASVQLKDMPDMADSPMIQQFVSLFADTGNMKPGETRNRGTLAEVARDWTWADVWREFPTKTIVPYETLDLTFQGLALKVLKGEECVVPEPFYDIYRDHLKAMKQAQINESYLLGVSDTPPSRNWQTPEGAMVRAYSTAGRRYGKPSGTMETGKIHISEEPNA